MDIAKFIHNLQNKSEPTKKLILWSTTTVIMILILSGWTLTSNPVGGDVRVAGLPEEEEQNALGNIWENLKKDTASLKEVLNIRKKVEEEVEEDSEENTPETEPSPTSKQESITPQKLPLSN